MEALKKEQIQKILRRRRADSHKGDYGKLIIMAGSRGMAGAAVLCARGALRSGVGLITLAVPDLLFPILQTAVPEAMCLERRAFRQDHAQADEERGISAKVQYDGLVIGPGLGNYPIDASIMREVLQNGHGPVVIDADGLNNIVRYDLKAACKTTKADLILTPHMGEGARLLGVERIENREEAAKELAKIYGGIVVLKGHETLIASPRGTVCKNTTGNPGMATGGTGDVLAGMIGGLAVQGYGKMEAVQTAVFLHGLAGDLCAAHLGEAAMTASDLVGFLPVALQDIFEGKGDIDG